VGQITAGGFALLGLAFPNQASAQFTGNRQTNTINGTAVNWPADYYVGSNYVSDALFIQNNGSLSSGSAYIGCRTNGNGNLAVVSGNASIWTAFGNNGTHIYVGSNGFGNRLVISNGGRMEVQWVGHTVVGGSPGANSNSVLVTGSGSVWDNNQNDVNIGDYGSYCSLVVSNGGAALGLSSILGVLGNSNIALVTGSGSIWSNSISTSVGDHGKCNTLIVSNGGAVFGIDGYIGESPSAQNNSVLISGNGSCWQNSGKLYVGYNATSNLLTVASGSSVQASTAYVGLSVNASNCLLHVSGGILTVTNLSGTGTINVRRGRLTFNGGTITADQLLLTNGVNSILEFNGGTLQTQGTTASNMQPCVVGDTVASGNFHLLGGVHSFQNGLRIRTNSFLTGCGTVNGSVVVDAGGTVRANCTNLVFNSDVTNNGTMVVDSAVLETFGTFVNNGKIFFLNGGTTNFHGAFINNGAILDGRLPLTITRDGSGGLFVRYAGAPDITYRLQRAVSVLGPWSDVATNTVPPSGLVEYHEMAPPLGKGFYRTVQP
jgi:autotransporter family porin